MSLRRYILGATAVGLTATGVWAFLSQGQTGAFEQAYSVCTTPIERPSTIESELAATQTQIDTLLGQGWRMLNVSEAVDYELYLSLYAIGPELLKVAAEGEEYGKQYQGAAPHDYWIIARNYLASGVLDNHEPVGPNGRTRWLIAGDDRALLRMDRPPATGCTYYQSAEHFDTGPLADVPASEIPGYLSGPYQYHVSEDALYDGGITEALMIDGTPFDELLRDDVPSSWQISIRRPM